MSFRITTSANGKGTTIRVEGRLTAESVPELRREVRIAGGAVELDLVGLISADADGVRELLELSARGAKLIGASVYVRQLMLEMVAR